MHAPSYARPLLEYWRVRVTDIPTSSKEESDFLASFAGCDVLIEEKFKINDPEYVSKRAERLAKGGIAVLATPFVRDNRLSGIVTKAASQLRSSSDRAHSFRLVWFTSTGFNAEAKYNQFIATLYGTTNILEMNSPHYRRCYFFRNSDFYRCADVVDGAVAAFVSGTSITVKLCLNPLSPNSDLLRDSPVTAAFGSAVEDPEVLEEAGTAFIVDCDIDRQDELALLGFLQAKYRTAPLMKIDIGHTSASVSVDVDCL